MTRWILVSLSVSLSVFAFTSCGGNGGNGAIDGPPGGGTDAPGGGGADADPNHPDGLLPPNCIPGNTQCSDCIDNDGDGYIDGYDVECTGAADDDEGSFATNIPGDNVDPKWQDCFFDGNSGAGDDHCRYHTCCIFGFTTSAECEAAGLGSFDPVADCATSAQCIAFCEPLVPPGCDCFGCCTLCDPVTNQCADVITNPAVAPNCDEQHIFDPAFCPACTLNTACGTPCNDDPNDCILCPGQDPNDLPPSCGGTVVCPAGAQDCTTTPCPGGSFCSASYCCVEQIP